MKVSEFLKKVGYIDRAEIRIEFRAHKSDQDPEVEYLDGDTPEESADRIIRRAAEYTLQEINFTDNAVMITGIKKAKRTPGRKPDKKQEERREEQKQAIADELERLDQAVGELIEAIAEPFRKIGQRKDRRRGGILAALKTARAAVRRILTRIFRRGGRRGCVNIAKRRGKRLTSSKRQTGYSSICRANTFRFSTKNIPASSIISRSGFVLCAGEN